MKPPSQSPARSDALRHDRHEPNVVFIHSSLDDLGLTAPQFRVYCHLARRANTGSLREGGAWPAVAEMARVCRLHPQTVRRALRWLTAQGMITCDRRQGATNVYRLTAASRWQSPAPVPDSEATPPNPIPAHPHATDGDEGYPSEGNPLKKVTPTDAALVVPSLEDVLQAAALRAIPPDCAEKFYHEKESIGWLDRHRHPLRSWPAALQAYAMSWRAVEQQRANAPTARSRPRPRNGASAIISASNFTSTQI